METRKAFFCFLLAVFVVGGRVCACGRWWSVWKPKTLCGARGGSIVFGKLVRLSGIRLFRGGLLHTRKPLMCIFRGVQWGGLWIWGDLCPFCRGGNLERLFCARGNLGFYALRELRGTFRDRWKLRGGFLRVWKLGLLAHTKLSVCIRGLRETSGLSCVGWNLERVRWWFHVVRWLWSFFFSAFRGTRWLCLCGKTSFFAFVYIFRSVGGVLSAWEHRAVGGSSDGGVKGIPLNNPHFG